MIEIWRDVDGCEGIYKVSNLGKIKSYKVFKKDGYLLKIPKRGYHTICCHGKNMTVHRLIAQAFIPNPENKPFINHKNGIKTDNRIENLEWCTSQENTLHAYRTGLIKQIKNNYVKENIKLNEEVRQEIIKILKPNGVSFSWLIRHLLREWLKDNHLKGK